MTSTFGLLNTAYSGLAAARAALDTTGQNISNASTAGYVRQRVDQASVGPAGSTAQSVGQGVSVTGIGRLNSAIADAQVRQTSASSGYWTTVSTAVSGVETSLNEPGDNGLSTTLSSFWSAWGTMSNQAGGSSTTAGSAAQALLGSAATLTSRIAAGYTAASTAWTGARSDAASTVTQVNDAAKQVATLNGQIRQAQASGANANELLDARDQALTTLSTLAGATTRSNADGSVDVSVGGRTLVSGTGAKTLVLAGSTTMEGASGAPVHLELSDSPGVAVEADGGRLAGSVATLAAANATGTGGVFAEAAAAYDGMASTLATQVNADSPGFFGFASTNGPAATNLQVLPTSLAGIGTTSGTSLASAADAVSQLGTAAASPDAAWSAYVSGIGATSKNASTQSTLATQAAATASTAQNSASGVDLDEETANLVVFQHAYAAAARVLTTVDQMLDTLINNTGIVGRA